MPPEHVGSQVSVCHHTQSSSLREVGEKTRESQIWKPLCALKRAETGVPSARKREAALTNNAGFPLLRQLS